MSTPCEQEENIRELKLLITDLTREFRGLLGEMREAFIEDREHKIKIENLEKGQEIIFEKLRLAREERRVCIENKIDPMVTWKDKMDGSLSAIKVVPIVCVIITTLIALFTFDHEKPDVKIVAEHDHSVEGLRTE